MFISHKSNVLQTFHETEWQCRRNANGLSKSEYWTWLDSVTSGDPPVVDLSGETGYTIVECTDEDVQARLNQLGDYVNSNRSPDEALVYNITWSDSKVSAVTGQDMEGNDVTIDTHFSGDDTAKDARLLADEWTRIRAERDRLLSETDWMALSDTGTVSTAWKNYRKALRDIPAEQSSGKIYNDITWPDKPE